MENRQALKLIEKIQKELFKDNFEDGSIYYSDLTSEERVENFCKYIGKFLMHDYDERKLEAVLSCKEILFKNAICLNDSELYADCLYNIVTWEIDWELKHCLIDRNGVE
ncbi:MAG: hypothetical protein LRY69_04770 [Gammaproteobacteria bacterium]|nr:hypothetical protein [Gammaproteobacteria bacterium]